jgi:hypothetical protein
MPSTDSGVPEKVDAMLSEQVVGMARNEWTTSIGIDGRHGPEHAPVPLSCMSYTSGRPTPCRLVFSLVASVCDNQGYRKHKALGFAVTTFPRVQRSRLGGAVGSVSQTAGILAMSVIVPSIYQEASLAKQGESQDV